MLIGWLDYVVVPVSMALDCMTLGATDGIKFSGIKKWKMFLCSFLFGFFQGMMPVIGYFLAVWIKSYIQIDEAQINVIIGWIAFALLAGLGLRSLWEWIKDRKDSKKEADLVKEEEAGKIDTSKLKDFSIPMMFLQAISTSIDALSLGFAYSSYGVGPSMGLFAAIGVITFLLSVLAFLFGKVIGPKLEKWADLIAAVVFLLVGTKILLDNYGLLPEWLTILPLMGFRF